MGDLTDTICALSTPPGRSGVAVVRMSGPESLSLVRQVFRPRKAIEAIVPRHALLGRIIDPRQGFEIDEAVVTCFFGPNSYTGEDVGEFSLHGSPVLVEALLSCLCGLGARLAEPGEFTMRAFLNGRIDLTQAEAVRDIIDSATLYQARVAARQRDGSLAREIESIKRGLIDVIVNLESAVEFVEEDLPVASREDLARQIGEIQNELKRWIDSYQRGRVIRGGFGMAVIGRPNVGKSSLFNALLARNRSIVTEIPGTTRDLVSEETEIGGIPVRLHDTAGIHDSPDRVEKLGIDRSRRAIADADAILLVVDASRPPTKEDTMLRTELGELPRVVVFNKTDLPVRWSAGEQDEFAGAWPAAAVSAKTLSGIDELRRLILQRLPGPEGMGSDGILVTNLRHCRSLEGADRDLSRSAAALKERLSEEFVLADLHGALRHLGAITGETGVEDLLTEIFSRFCVGK